MGYGPPRRLSHLSLSHTQHVAGIILVGVRDLAIEDRQIDCLEISGFPETPPSVMYVHTLHAECSMQDPQRDDGLKRFQ